MRGCVRGSGIFVLTITYLTKQGGLVSNWFVPTHTNKERSATVPLLSAGTWPGRGLASAGHEGITRADVLSCTADFWAAALQITSSGLCYLAGCRTASHDKRMRRRQIVLQFAPGLPQTQGNRKHQVLASRDLLMNCISQP